MKKMILALLLMISTGAQAQVGPILKTLKLTAENTKDALYLFTNSGELVFGIAYDNGEGGLSGLSGIYSIVFTGAKLESGWSLPPYLCLKVFGPDLPTARTSSYVTPFCSVRRDFKTYSSTSRDLSANELVEFLQMIIRNESKTVANSGVEIDVNQSVSSRASSVNTSQAGAQAISSGKKSSTPAVSQAAGIATSSSSANNNNMSSSINVVNNVLSCSRLTPEAVVQYIHGSEEYAANIGKIVSISLYWKSELIKCP